LFKFLGFFQAAQRCYQVKNVVLNADKRILNPGKPRVLA